MNLAETFLINPFLNVLIAVYFLLDKFAIPGAFGLSIIALSVVLKMALWPFMAVQLKSSKKMVELKPHLDRIKKEHGHDKLRHQQEMTKLYKEHGFNPLAGCLPALLQIPIFLALYAVLAGNSPFMPTSFVGIVNFKDPKFLESINGHLYPALHLTEIPGTTFLGFSLGAKPDQWAEVGFLILLIPIITGALQFIQSKMMAPEKPKAVGQKETKGEKQMEDTMSQVQSQMVYLMPAMIAFFSYGFPVGLSLYWNTFTIIGIIQQWKIAGAGSLNKYLPLSLQK